MAQKIIIGAGDDQYDGWVSTNCDQLDLRDRQSWEQFAPASLDAVLTEHVLEHLYPKAAAQAARNVYDFLRPGGYWRIAVPDANNPDPKYFEHCRPGGEGQARYTLWGKLGIRGDYPDHKVFFNLESLTSLLESSGFEVRPLEWFTPCGQFRQNPWQQSDGPIKRCAGNTWRRFWMYLYADICDLSLIVDAVKR